MGRTANRAGSYARLDIFHKTILGTLLAMSIAPLIVNIVLRVRDVEDRGFESVDLLLNWDKVLIARCALLSLVALEIACVVSVISTDLHIEYRSKRVNI